MFLVLSYDGDNEFDIMYIKDNERQTLVDAIETIGNRHQRDLYLSKDNEVYDLSEIDEDDIDNENFDEYETIGSIDIYDSTVLSIEGEVI